MDTEMVDASIRVLLVEDDEEDCLLTRRLLEESGRATFEATWVRSYDAALLELKNGYDVCLVDYDLGAETGLSLIEQAITNGYHGPMILLTGHGTHDIDVKAMKAGAADYLVKGQITPQLMERVIRYSLERKAAEAALLRSQEQLRQSQKLEAIGSLAGGVAHDFNNLLSIILCYSELLAANFKVGDPMRDDLEEIRSAGLRASALTRQLLAFGRQQVLQPQLIDLTEVFAGMESMLRRLIGEDVEITAVMPVLHKIRADHGQIEQVIMNLAVNARDAMPRGGRITIEASEVILDGPYAAHHIGVLPGPHIMLTVSDTGAGMDSATLARAFEPFFTTKPMGKGTGLGLATVFGIINQSGATIWVDSKVGSGTTFTMYFPVPDGSEEISAPAVPLERRTLRGTETILVVEDEARLRVLACAILRKYGYNILEAPSGGDALLICEDTPSIDLLLTDVVLPRMSGRQLAERLLKVRPEMKVLYMSGYTNDAVVHHGVREASIAFIQKPITPEALARKVRETLGLASRLLS
jgi:two-component system, cell cycle sensor histidine kinase and response regulator CckA